MQELNQILEKEKQAKEIVEKAKAQAAAEKEKIKKGLETEFESAKVLSEEEQSKLLALQEREKAVLDKKYQDILQNELFLLEKKSKSNFNKAVDYLSRFLLDFYVEGR